MCAAAPSDEPAQTSFVLNDVFKITGRGLVIVGSEIAGTIHIGDRVVWDGGSAVIKGIEALNFADPDAHARDTAGFLVESDDKAFFQSLIGTRLLVESAS